MPTPTYCIHMETERLKDRNVSYGALVITAHPDDAEVQMGGTIAKLTESSIRVLIIDLCDGEPADFAEPGVRVEQARRAAEILGADRLFLSEQDRLIQDTIPLRLELARLIREHRPRIVFGTAEACVHPDHAAIEPLVTAAVFYGRLQNWGKVPGGDALRATEPWIVERLFFPHCKMEPAWGESFHFAVDVSDTYDRKKAALEQYRSIFQVEASDQLLGLYEAEDMHMGRLFGVRYAEIFKAHSPLLIDDITVFKPGLHA
jgi:LmbE family N-acetylglucosaminyl deacetylase